MRRDGRRRGVATTLLAAALVAAGAVPAAAQEPGARAEGEVWRVTLDEAVQAALRGNPTLRESQSQIQQARQQRTAAYGAFLPDLSLGYGFSDASTGRLDPTGQSITTTSFSSQLEGSIQLFDGFRRFRDLESARRGVEAQEATHRLRRFETILQVKQAFFNAVAAQERVRVEEDRVERQQQQLEFVRQQIRLGRATRSDSLRSRVDLNDARLALLNARNDARNAEFALAEAMGVRQQVAPVQEASLDPQPIPVGRDVLIRAAVEQAPAVQSARLSASAAEAEVAGAQASFLPSLSLTAGWAWQDAGFPPKNRSWSLRLSGSLPLFDGFQRETSVATARAQADAARAREQAEILAVRREVDAALAQVETARAGIDLARESVELSREDLRVSQQRYRLGAATILDLRAAQISLEQSQVDLIRRRFDYQVAVAELESVLGADLEGVAASPDPGPGGPPSTGRPPGDDAAPPGRSADPTRDPR